MVVVSSTSVDAACNAFSNGLKNLVTTEGSDHASKACLICDCLLEWNDDGFLTKARLKSLKERLSGEGVEFESLHPDLKHYYSYKGKGHETWMDGMFLSPRGVFDECKGFNCCKECCKVMGSATIKPSRMILPMYAIANGSLIGDAPLELTQLNDVELALVSLARVDKHVFTFYGGAHKSMRGWHNLYENDVENIAGALQQLEAFGAGKTVACILQGPFTKYQLSKVKERTMIRPPFVLRALRWLKRNNLVYREIRIPRVDELPTPIIIDDSEQVESANTAIESRFEYTVVFPGTEEINSTNGGHISQEAFRLEVIESLDTSNSLTVVSRPTQNRIKDYEGDSLMRAFPLQFPYGIGLKTRVEASSSETTRNEAKIRLKYLFHLQRLSIRHMHRGDFILVIHNMYEKHKAVSIAYLRCLHKEGDQNIAELFANMTVEQLQNAINRVQSHTPNQDRVTAQLLRSIDAVCKNMGHTNDAAKSARLKLFANTVRFGQGSIFLTVTPDDSNCFRINIYVLSKCKDPPTCLDDLAGIDADFEMSHKIRQEFPGLCAFDFQQITELLFAHILGWDEATQKSKPGGGAFGILEAWSDSIEEQGRKTLHGHFILWVRGWSSLLLGLRSDNVSCRNSAVTKLRNYIDVVLSTKLFGGATTNIIQTAYFHECKLPKPRIPIICQDQSIRNLRYKHGESDFGDNNFLKCPDCSRVFNMEDLVRNVLIEWFGSEVNLERKVQLAVKRYGAQIDSPDTPEMCVKRDFLVHASNNLHASSHVQSCFKKGFECRNKLPDCPCKRTAIHFDTTNMVTWWSWDGTSVRRAPFYSEPTRHLFDVFMNRYHRRLSTILGCNTNVQCGIDGAHMMYVTYYSTKNTQTEDKLAYCKVAKTLYARIRRQEEAQLDPELCIDAVQAPTPFCEGYRRLLSAVLSHTQGHVVSAPMAWFIMRKGCRFLFSNDFGYVCVDGMLGRMTASRIAPCGPSVFLDNKLNDYVFRPKELERVNLYDFISCYDIKYASNKNELDMMPFLEEHPQSDLRGVMNRLIHITPLVSYLDFPDSSDFEGNITDSALQPTLATEQYAKSVLCLFVPFRNHTMFTESEPSVSYTRQFREAIHSGEIDETTQKRLQNIQDCRNMMKSGRQKDSLERTTQPLPDPIKGGKQDEGETDEDVAKHIDECLTELVSQLDVDNNLGNEANHDINELSFMSLSDLRGSGKDHCGYNCIKPPEFQESNPVYEFAAHTSTNTDMENDPLITVTSSAKILSKRTLTTLSIQSIKRNVEQITELAHIRPTGTAASIQKWARIAFQDRTTGAVDETQQRAFEVITSTFVSTFHDEAERNIPITGTPEPYSRSAYNTLRSQLKMLAGMRNQRQLIMFLSGAGGSGKTEVINSVLAYAKGFCKEIEYVFDKRMIVVTAMSGVAATLINGETVHSAAHLNCKKITVEHQKEWANARMVIVDEISFASSSDIFNLNDKLTQLKELAGQKYGGLHVIFTGDFSQLEPVNGTPLYHEPNFAPWHDWINCYVELTGQHRFKDDPEFGNILKRIREGCPTAEDIATINTRIVNGDYPNAPSMADLPNNLAYAVYRNLDRAAINNGIFAEHIKHTHSSDKSNPPPSHTLIIRSDDLTWKANGKQFGALARHILWSQCKDTDITTGFNKSKKYVDTFLKLYHNIPLMYTENTDVSNGKASGTLCFLVKICLKNGVTDDDFELMNIDGFWVRTIGASKVDYLLCQFAGSEKQFKIPAQTNQCSINMPIELIPGMKTRHTVSAHINRFPVLTNHATTGHKLQGQTKESLLISAWYYGKNWPYVVLSRVKRLTGLFLRVELDPSHDFSLDPRLVRMLTKMKTKVPLPYGSD